MAQVLSDGDMMQAGAGRSFGNHGLITGRQEADAKFWGAA